MPSTESQIVRRPGHGRKVCPDCQQLVPSKRTVCPCGYVFRAGGSLAEYLPLVEKIVQGYVRKVFVQDMDEYGDACLGLVEAINSFDGSVPFGVWVRRRVKQRLIDSHRKQTRQRRQHQREELEDVPIEDTTKINEMRDFAHLLLSKYPGDTRDDRINRSIVKCWMRGTSFQDIAFKLDQSEAWVRKRWIKAIATMRARYRQQLREFDS